MYDGDESRLNDIHTIVLDIPRTLNKICSALRNDVYGCNSM
jgi:hypothetical protein